jgi:hypothetical protein
MTINGESTVNVAYVLTAFSVAIIFFRILLGRLSHERFKFDDGLMIFAVALYAIHTATYPIIVNTLLQLFAWERARHQKGSILTTNRRTPMAQVSPSQSIPTN